jgi:hypothetical protein
VSEPAPVRERAGPFPPVKVIYLLGLPHSGTTLLCNLLGEFDGCVSVGELCLLWQRVCSGSGECGCGQTLEHCSFWQRVLRSGVVDATDTCRMAELTEELQRARHLPAFLFWRAGCGSRAADCYAYRAALARLYRGLAAAANASTVIDSSKAPAIGLLLNDLAGVDVHIVHVVRDSRPNLHSRPWREGRDMSLAGKLLSWDAWHAFAELRWSRDPRYVRVRYEDLIAAPARTLERVLRAAGHSAHGSPLLSDDRALLGTHHTVFGNRNRFATGEIRLTVDTRWQRELPPAARALTTVATWPLLLRHGYVTGRPSHPGKSSKVPH